MKKTAITLFVFILSYNTYSQDLSFSYSESKISLDTQLAYESETELTENVTSQKHTTRESHQNSLRIEDVKLVSSKYGDVAFIPNEYSEELTITMEKLLKEGIITISDDSGNILNSATTRGSGVSIDFSSFRKGTYLLEIFEAGKVVHACTIVKI